MLIALRLVVLAALLCALGCTNARAQSQGAPAVLTVQLFDDAQCSTPSVTPAVNLPATPTYLIPAACSAPPASLAQSGFALYETACSNSTGDVSYQLWLWPTTAAGCNMTGSAATLWSIQASVQTSNESSDCTPNDVAVLIQPSNATRYTRYSKWSCLPPANNSAALASLPASLFLLALAALVSLASS